MPVQASHIIHRINVDFNTNTKHSAEHINKNVNHYVHTMILPAIEEIIAKKYAHFSLRLNELEVDLNFDSEKKISAFQFKNAIEIALEKSISQQKNRTQDALVTSKEVLETEQNFSDTWSVLFHFLKTGSVPWYVSQETKIEQCIALCEEELTKNKVQKKELEALKLLIANNKTVQLRLLKQLPENFTEQIFETVHSKVLSQAWRDFRKQMAPIENSKIVQNLVEYAFQVIASSFNTKTQNSQEISWEMGFLLKKLKIVPTSLENNQQLKTHVQTENIVNAFKALFLPIQISIDTAAILKMVTEVPIKNPEETNQSTTSEKILDTPINPLGLKGVKAILQKRAEETTSNIFHFAGLIILHPYLKMFFKNIDIPFENKNQIPPKHYDLAAHTLYYLATAQTHGYESDMQFIKWLLNIPEGIVIDRNYKVSQQIIDESENLLSSVIENWTALKNSSNDTLRTLFFHRTASLKEDANGYQLHFERKAQDVLLHQLPWNIGIVKLPWKQKLIQISW